MLAEDVAEVGNSFFLNSFRSQIFARINKSKIMLKLFLKSLLPVVSVPIFSTPAGSSQTDG
jgi:hypothetical protein